MNINKLGKKLELKRSGLFLIGFKKNTYVSVTNLSKRFVVRMRFPFAIDEDDVKNIEVWNKMGYANDIKFPNESIFDVEIYFNETSFLRKYKRVNEVIQSISQFIYEKHPDAKPQCCGDHCTVNEGLSIYKYKYDASPFPMCSSCVRKYQTALDLDYKHELEKPNNYLKGIIGALLFSVPCTLVSLLASFANKLIFVTGVCNFFLTQLGFKLFKGKLNTFGTILVSIFSMIYTVAGTSMGYIFAAMQTAKQNILYEDLSRKELFRLVINHIKTEPDVKGEFILFISLSALLCGICIISGIIKSRKKTTIKKAFN